MNAPSTARALWIGWPLALLLAACSGSARTAESNAPPQPSAAEPAKPPPAPRTLTVFAAASLREVFTQLGQEFERTHAGVSVQLNFAGTQELRTQIEHGAPADVLASADQQHMDALAQQGKVARSQLFAHNQPVVAVPKDVASAPASLQELPRAERLVIAAPEVPIGRYTLQIFDRAGVQFGAKWKSEVLAHVVSRELNTRQVLAKVSLGEADAAIVYKTDVLTAQDRVRAIPIAENINAVADYPIAVLQGAGQPELAHAFVAFVMSDAGQAALERAGFSRAGSLSAGR